MTQDVGRLHQEKQVIEQQIADLFAFYSKQKQEAEVGRAYSECTVRLRPWHCLIHRITHDATHLQGQWGLVICRICPRRHRSDHGDRYPILFSRERIDGLPVMGCRTAGYLRHGGKAES